MTQEKEFKAVKFDHYGGLDVLHIAELLALPTISY